MTESDEWMRDELLLEHEAVEALQAEMLAELKAKYEKAKP